MLRLTRKFLRFEPGPNWSTEVLGNALKAVPMSLEPCNLAGKRGGVKEFVRNCTSDKRPRPLAKCARLHRPRVWSGSSFGSQERPARVTGFTRRLETLAEQASTEMNSEKLLELVNELNQVLGEGEDKPRQQRHQGNQL
jgi:hypothetical protein